MIAKRIGGKLALHYSRTKIHICRIQKRTYFSNEFSIAQITRFTFFPFHTCLLSILCVCVFCLQQSDSLSISESRRRPTAVAMRRMSAATILLRQLQNDFAKHKKKRDTQTAPIEILEDAQMYFKIKFNTDF